ncbi:MAG: LarC family nickel insertion protein, partial [bacterium]|nr:LarC family nickel insertion protein [bacterium]
MTAEAISFAMDRMFEAGALEVFTTPAYMKKSRPGTLLTILCREKDRETIVKVCFKHTSTIGIREKAVRRYELSRSTQTLSTPCGEIRRKDSCGYGVARSKYEYDDIARIAQEQNLSFQAAIQQVDDRLK